ncbi:single-stranded dna-binding protein chloroplastic-like [Stylonychia lemnae]|uniref:Single-stranded dna-binding protein chloroplastic-like n=1 Tax=Stylonychia lemnae TaxID=5949 RepID=A0A078AZM9_STYLE|nr:single-stranded dna-binding protein chloroplastic-like [Stylonychia lemnae]|eukprot:CDW87556.1 single-stranded dna-binding protein chloroplastic-like [Stylonychia lemnae]
MKALQLIRQSKSLLIKPRLSLLANASRTPMLSLQSRSFNTNYQPKTYQNQQYNQQATGGQYQDRLSYNGKKIYLRGLNIVKSDVMLNVQIKPASYQQKQDSYQVNKNGYVVFDFTPVQQLGDKAEMMNQQKKTIILTLKNIGEILALDTKPGYNAEVDEEGIFVQYQPKENEPVKVMKMNKLEDGKTYKFNYCEIVNDSEVVNNLAINISTAELLTIQSLLNFATPYLLGWHAILNPHVVDLQ